MREVAKSKSTGDCRGHTMAGQGHKDPEMLKAAQGHKDLEMIKQGRGTETSHIRRLPLTAATVKEVVVQTQT